MYFPYFRGRQYELLALKELAIKGLIGENVIPVVEPVKLTSTFDGTFKAFNNAQLSIALIFNPAVGELREDCFEPIYDKINGNNNVIPSLLFNEAVENTAESLLEKGVLSNEILTVFDNRGYLDTYKSLFDNSKPKYTLCPDKTQIKRAVRTNKVLFEDKFNKRDRNADYPEDEFFSEDHLYFKEDGFLGFGDYSIVGNEYNESGFAPYAVAIHIVYFDFTDETNLKIKHFISDSNDDISDVAGKFHEAVSKLASWYYSSGQEQQLTSALSTLLDHAKNGTYPGLPTIKKLSIMHHLELINKYLIGGF
jgi:hypothetical protein